MQPLFSNFFNSGIQTLT